MSTKAWALVLVVAAAAAGAAVWLLLGGGPPWNRAEERDAREADARAAAAEVAHAVGRQGSAAAAAHDSRPARPLPPTPATGESTVVGRLAEAGNGAAIAGATVVLRHPQGEFAVVGETKPDGAFVLERVPGVVGARVFVNAAGFGPRVLRDVNVPPHDRLDLGLIELERGVPIHGRVLTMLGAPIAGAQVDLLESRARSTGERMDIVRMFGEVRQDDESLDQAFSAADGTFSFAGAAPGSWVIAASKAGFQVRFSSVVTVVRGAAPPGVDLRLVEGRRLPGIVKSEAGAPVPGAEVAALEWERDQPFGSKSQKAKSGADGRFSFSTLGSADVILFVNAAGYAGTTRFGLRADGSEVEVVLRRCGRIEGRVFDRATGKGLPGAIVVAYALEEMIAIEETRSGADGTYAIDAAPAGKNLSMFAKLPGWTLAGLADVMLADQPTKDLTQDRAFRQALKQGDIDPGGVLRRDLPMVAGGSASGRVVDDSTGEGIAGAEVTLRHLMATLEIFGCADRKEGRSATDGSFTIGPLGAGQVSAVAHAEGYLGLWDLMPDPGDPASQRPEPPSAVIPPGGSATGITLRMRRGRDVDVLVTDQDRNPLAGARVTWMVTHEDLGTSVLGSNRRPRVVPTDGSGKARLKGVAARADIVIAARHPSSPAGTWVTADVTAPSPAPVTIALAPGASIAGVVIDFEGRPAADRAIRFEPARNDTALAFGEWTWAGHRAVTDAAGKFLFESLGTGPGTISVFRRAADSGEVEECIEAGTRSLELRAGRREELRLQLVRPLAISGTVFDASGNKLSKATVHWTLEGTYVSGRWVQTGDDGAYRLENACPGTYRIQVHRSGGPPETLTRTVAAGSTGVDFRFTK